MGYLVYYTDTKIHHASGTPDLSRLMPMSSDTKEDAIDISIRILKANGIVWKIEGSDGLIIDRAVIEGIYEMIFGRKVGI